MRREKEKLIKCLQSAFLWERLVKAKDNSFSLGVFNSSQKVTINMHVMDTIEWLAHLLHIKDKNIIR